MCDYTLKYAIDNKTFIPNIFGIYLNSDGTIYKILSNIEGNNFKKNSLGTFDFILKQNCYSIIIIEDDFYSNHINVLKRYDYINKLITDSELNNIIKNNNDCYIFSMEFNNDLGFNSKLLYNPN
jgi:hypothetical protein